MRLCGMSEAPEPGPLGRFRCRSHYWCNDPLIGCDPIESHGADRHAPGDNPDVIIRINTDICRWGCLMKHTLLFAALCLTTVPALAHVHACDVDSDYDVALSPEAITFTRDDGAPHKVVVHDGQLSVDGQLAALTAGDRDRLRQFERDARALAPEIRGVTLEAVQVAFSALEEVAKGLAPDRPKLHEQLDKAHSELIAQLDQPEGHFQIDEDAIAASVERLVGEVTPILVGEITSAAIAAALSGDEDKVKEIEARAERMEKDIEAKVEARADALEARAEALCPRIAALDELDDALAYRLDDGRALDLLRTRQ